MFLSIFFSRYSIAQLTVNNAPPYNDPAYLVEKVLFNTGLKISNIKFNKVSGIPGGINETMIGYFNGSASNIGIKEGVILATGSIFVAPGPNDRSSASSGGHGLDPNYGDADLTNLALSQTYDAAVLEFDFESMTDGISFRYAFASEEYNEYVCSKFNDVFAFFISGPGITGSQNIALLPGTATEVAINSVNNGTIGSNGTSNYCTSLTNSNYYVDNEKLGEQSVQYDGFTKVLVAKKDLIPCETYHIKMAVADVGDELWDSGVFLEAASFGTPGVRVSVGSIGNTTASLTEGCGYLKLIFSRPKPTDNSYTVYPKITGSATNGVDYTFIPDSIVIPAGQNFVEINISAMFDGVSEGIENLIVTTPSVISNNTCIDDEESTVSVSIINTDPLSVLPLVNDTICPGSAVSIFADVTGGVSPYTYNWSDGSTGSSITVSPQSAATYSVNVSDACNTGSVYSEKTVVIADIWVTSESDITIYEGCSDALIEFTRTKPNGWITVPLIISGTATNGIDYRILPDSITFSDGQLTATLEITPLDDLLPEGNETVSITIAPSKDYILCVADGADVTIVDVSPLKVNVNNDTTVCITETTELTALVSGGLDSVYYSWNSNGNFLGDQPELIVVPVAKTTYTVAAWDTCGHYDAKSVTVAVRGIGMLGDTLAVEGCKDAGITFFRADTGISQIIDYSITGTAKNIDDYDYITGSVDFRKNESAVSISIMPVLDLITEGDETATLTIINSDDFETCFNNTVTVRIKDVEKLEVKPMDDVVICNEAVRLNAVASGGYGFITYNWSYDNTLLTDLYVIAKETTVYMITVFDSCQTQQVSNEVTVEVDCEFFFETPNAFTPNGDGVNDVFSGKGKGIRHFKMRIYNRWGDDIYYTDNVYNGWDGRANNGKDFAQQDIYVYIIEITDLLNFPHRFVGRIALIR